MHGLIFHEVSAQKFHLSGLAELCIFPFLDFNRTAKPHGSAVCVCVCVCVCMSMLCSALSLLQRLECAGILRACGPVWCGLFHCQRSEHLAHFTNWLPPVPLPTCVHANLAG